MKNFVCWIYKILKKTIALRDVEFSTIYQYFKLFYIVNVIDLFLFLFERKNK